MSSLKSLLLLTTAGCFYAKSCDVAACRVLFVSVNRYKPIQTTQYAATPPRLVYTQLWSNNSDFSEDIVTP
jgi:hypothetical protein